MPMAALRARLTALGCCEFLAALLARLQVHIGCAWSLGALAAAMLAGPLIIRNAVKLPRWLVLQFAAPLLAPSNWPAG